MRPALKAGLLPVWRDRDTLQIGVDPRRAVALARIGPAAAVISLLDGTRDRSAVIATAQAYGVPAPAAERVLELLAVAGVLDDYPAALHRSLSAELRARLAPELAAASLAYRDSDGGARTLARRRDAYVRVHGAGRIGTGLATLLGASGVGRVVCVDPAPVSFDDLSPGGLVQADVGSPRAEAAARAIRRAAPETRIHDPGLVPDLVVLTTGFSPELPLALVRDGVRHLAVRAAEAIGVVGPLVVPRGSACLHCVELRKAEGDAAWPKVLAQSLCAEPATVACDVRLAAMAAALGAAQVLAVMDGARIDDATGLAVVDGTLEVVLPGWQWRRRTWRPHPACPCGASRPG
jgi:ThiF family